MRVIWGCILALIWGYAYTSMAQEHYVFSEINSQSGLSENKVRGMVQLNDGRLIFETTGLSNIYNGANFSYLHAYNSNHILLSDYAGYHRLYVDADERVWIKNSHRLKLIDLKKERYVAKPDSVLQGLGLQDKLSDFFIDSQKNIWALSTSDTLYIKEAKAKQFKPFTHTIPAKDSANDRLFDIETKGSKVYFFYRSGATACVDLMTNANVEIANPLSKHGPSAYANTLLVVLAKHYIYYVRNGNRGGIIYRLNLATQKWELVLETTYWLNTLSVNKAGKIWVSCRDGLWIISDDLTCKQNLKTLQLVDGEAIDSEISTLMHDNQGGLWVGTLNRGLLYYHPDRFKFKHIGRTLFNNVIAGDLRVSCFTSDAQNRTLIGTQQGLYVYDNLQKKLHRFRYLPKAIDCTALYTDNHNRTWIATREHGLYITENAFKEPRFFSSDCAYNFQNLADTALCLATEKGLKIINLKTLKPTHKSKYLLQNYAVYQTIAYNKNTLLGRSNAGLFIFNFKSKEVVFNGADTLNYGIFKQRNNQINALYKDRRGLIWCATQDGISVWDASNPELRVLYTDDGIINNSTQSVIEDHYDRIWVSTANGLSCITVTEAPQGNRFSVANYNTYDGVISSEFTPNAVYKSGYGDLFWGGLDGFNVIYNSNLRQKEQVLPAPIFTAISILGKPVSANKNSLPQSIIYTKTLQLAHHQNYINIAFSALNYTNPSKTYYRYRLENANDIWHTTKAKDGLGEATYTNMAPGNYTLKVYASNTPFNWPAYASSIKISITPPFWRTKWAYFIYIGVIILVIRLYWRNSKKRLIKQQEEKLNAYKFRFFTNISHELKTPLTLIITPLEAILSTVENTSLKLQLTSILNNANNLHQLVNQLLDFRRIETNTETLNSSLCYVSEQMQHTAESFQVLASKKNMVYRIDITPLIYADIDSDKLNKIANNLLSNAFKFTPEGGKIVFRLDIIPVNKTASALLLEVTDTGKGIAAKDQSRIYARFYQTDKSTGNTSSGSGIGLHMVREFVKLHNGTIALNSNLGKGSKFTVTIPLTAQPLKAISDDDNGPHRAKILIVEDNDQFRSFLSDQLSSIYQVITADNGKSGLTRIKAEHPDLIISDINMPQLDGIELCKRLKNDIHISHIPIILLTAHGSELSQKEGFEAKADAYITKPFNLNILQIRIKNLLETQAYRKRLFKKAIVIQPRDITSSTVDESLIKTAIAIIQQNVDNSAYTVEQLSTDMHMDRTVLYRKLMAIVGQTPSAFIRSIRLKQAALLLKNGLSVSEVATQVGFGTLSYFGKCFQEEYGVSPSKFNKQT